MSAKGELTVSKPLHTNDTRLSNILKAKLPFTPIYEAEQTVMLNIQNHPAVHDSILEHASTGTLAKLVRASKYLHTEVAPVLYSHVHISAFQLGRLVSLVTSASGYLPHMKQLTIHGKIPQEAGSSVDVIAHAIKTNALPKLGRVEWLPDSRPSITRIRGPPRQYVEPEAEELIDSRYIHWQCTYQDVYALPCSELVIRGSFAILQFTYTAFHLENHTKNKSIRFVIDSAADFSSDCPVALWTGLGAHSATRRRMTIELAPQLRSYGETCQAKDPAPAMVSFPVYSALPDRLAFMVHRDLVRLTLVGFPVDADHQHAYHAGFAGAADGGRVSRLDVRDLGNYLLFKLWNIYTISVDQTDRVQVGSGQLDG